MEERNACILAMKEGQDGKSKKSVYRDPDEPEKQAVNRTRDFATKHYVF